VFLRIESELRKNCPQNSFQIFNDPEEKLATALVLERRPMQAPARPPEDTGQSRASRTIELVAARELGLVTKNGERQPFSPTGITLLISGIFIQIAPSTPVSPFARCMRC